MTTRRFTAQRWLLDTTIRTVGMDWDQPRSIYLSAPMGPEANADSAALCKQRLTRFCDRGVAAHMINVRAGVDDVTDRLRCNFFDGCNDGICIRT